MNDAAVPSLRRHRPFRLFWWARVATTIAFQMQAVAIGWQVYALTGSALDLGLIGLAQFVPGFALSLIVGQIADRHDRRRILGLCQGVEALVALALALASAFGWLTTGRLFAAVFVVGAARATELPTLHALMPQLVPAALLPIFARDILMTGPWGLGLLRSAPAVGALSAALVLSRRPLGGGVGRIMFIAVIGFGVATIVFALSTSFPLSLAALAVLGAADSVSVVIRFSLVQIATPDAMRGRVSAVNSMSIGASNSLGEFESGVTAAWFGTVPAVLIGGVGTIVVALLWLRLFPELFRIDRLMAR